MKRFLIGLLTLPLAGQTVPAGEVYQALATNGVQYLMPTEGAQILDQKAKLNWKQLLLNLFIDGTVDAAFAGAGGIVHMPQSLVTALIGIHDFADKEGPKILTIAAPNPAAVLASVLPMNGSLTVTSATCADATVFASSITTVSPNGTRMRVKAKAVKNLATSSIGPTIMIDGAQLTFMPQAVGVLVNAAGSPIDQFIIVHVLICPLQFQTPVTPLGPSKGTSAVPSQSGPTLLTAGEPVYEWPDIPRDLSGFPIRELLDDGTPEAVRAWSGLRDAALVAGDQREAYRWSEKIAAFYKGGDAPIHPCGFESCETWEHAELAKR